MRKRGRKFLEENLLKNGVLHTTLNPDGPGAIRIHLKPSRNPWDNPSTVTVNGMDIIPVNPSWTIMLCILINQINLFDGKEITKKDRRRIVWRTLWGMKKVYFFRPLFFLWRELKVLFYSLVNIAYGKPPITPVKMVSIGEYAPNMLAPDRMDLLVSAMTDECGKWHCNQKCVHCYAAGQEVV